MFRKFVSYYLPFDPSLSFCIPMIWENAKQYAYRHAIAAAALVAISLTAGSYGFALAAVTAHALAIVTIFLATVFTAAALDPRFR